MTRPGIVRADTIDLQDHDAPSAKDHHRQNLAPGPHQQETLREVAHESAEEQSRSPRISWVGDAPLVQHYDDHDSYYGGGTMSAQQQRQHQEEEEEDALAVAQNGGISSSDEGDGDDDLDDDMMDRISSSPSIEDEDIDFEFVYALHTFVATVEGQANATKGDTMVLLDDSNSYWWLVRVVKDSSIGYLPAEHIETPTERLARLNKHRNVDLSAAMLGDQAPGGKSTKPSGLKGIRKRWKSVTFSEPTYVDYTGGDYSSDDDDEIEQMFGHNAAAAASIVVDEPSSQDQQADQQAQKPASASVADDGAAVEPLKTRSRAPSDATTGTGATSTTAVSRDSTDSSTDDEDARPSQEGPSRSRNGTVRNTDSFFKDDSVETKKITLTPDLLLDESKEGRTSSSSQAQRPSLESKMDRELMSDRDSKKRERDARATADKKEQRDKKPSAIRNFFSRKDKKRSNSGDHDADDADSAGKRSVDVASEPRDSEDAMAPQSPEKSVTRSPSKLQKAQARTEPSPTRKNSRNGRPPPQPDLSYATAASADVAARTNDVSHVPPASMRIVDPDTQETREVSSTSQYQQQQQQQQTSSSGASSLAQSLMPRSLQESSSSLTKPQKTVKAKTRMELDESDSSEVPPAAQDDNDDDLVRPQLPGAFPSEISEPPAASTTNYLSDPRGLNGGEVSPVSDSQNPPGLTGDYSPSPVASPSPDGRERGDLTAGAAGAVGVGAAAAAAAAAAGAAPPPHAIKTTESWDDDKLRAFFDQGDNVRDLLAVVYDTSDVDPVAHDHPVVGGFREQNARLAEITTQLDNMLGDWLARKQRSRGTV